MVFLIWIKTWVTLTNSKTSGTIQSISFVFLHMRPKASSIFWVTLVKSPCPTQRLVEFIRLFSLSESFITVASLCSTFSSWGKAESTRVVKIFLQKRRMNLEQHWNRAKIIQRWSMRILHSLLEQKQSFQIKNITSTSLTISSLDLIFPVCWNLEIRNVNETKTSTKQGSLASIMAQ